VRTPVRALPFALTLVVLAACGRSGPTPVELRPADLVRFAERYDGEVVATTGIVHRIAEPEHYWIADDELNRVAVEPRSAVADRVGERVRVVGRFSFDRSSGRVIEVRSVSEVE